MAVSSPAWDSSIEYQTYLCSPLVIALTDGVATLFSSRAMQNTGIRVAASA